MKNLSGIQSFVKVGALGSFSAAAHELQQTPSAVSKAVKLLEAELGVQLFRRTTRMLSFTPDGILFFERCKRALQELEEAKEAMLRAGAGPSGKLRLDIPVAFGHKKVVPHLHRFTREYPRLDLDVTLTDKFSNLVRDEIDIAVRISNLEDSAYFQKKLCEVKLVLCASPDYIARAGMPQTLEELRRHECVTYLSYQNPKRPAWNFDMGGKRIAFQPESRLRFNTGDSILEALKQGAGIGRLFDFMVEDEYIKGSLVPVMPHYTADPLPVYALYQPHRHLSPKIRACLDFLAKIM